MKFNEKYKLDLLLRMAHNNTAIEGNTLTYGDTYTIIVDKHIPANTSVKEFYEVDNHRNAISYIFSNYELKELTLEHIQDLHKLITYNINFDAGEFRKGDNAILGATFSTPKASEVYSKIREWLANTNYRLSISKTNDEKIDVILEQHLQFEKIHPFSDGNGRVGRMIMLLQALQNDIPPFIIEKNDRPLYITALHTEELSQLKALAKQKSKEEENRILNYSNEM